MADAHRSVVSAFKLLLCIKPYARAAASPSRPEKKSPAFTSSPTTQCSVCQRERSSRASGPTRSSTRAAGFCAACEKERRRASSVVSTSAAAGAATFDVASSSILRRPSKLLRIAGTLLGRLTSNSRVAVDYVWAVHGAVDVEHIDPPLPVVRKPPAAGSPSLWERRRGDRLRALDLR